MTAPAFQCGDVVEECGKSRLSRLIAWATRGWHEAKTVCTHVGRMVNATDIAEAGLRFVVHPLDTVRRIRVWRYKHGFAEGDLGCMRSKAMYYKGRAYGWWKLIPHLADGLLEKVLPFKSVYLFRRLLFLKNYPICSWEVAWTLWECAGLLLGTAPRYATPDDVADFLAASPAWECVYNNVTGA